MTRVAAAGLKALKPSPLQIALHQQQQQKKKHQELQQQQQQQKQATP